MNHGLESGFAYQSGVACPLLLECNPRGRVLWMSDRARAVLGSADHLIDAIPEGTANRPGDGGLVFGDYLFWRVFESRESILIGAQSAEAEKAAVAGELRRLESNMVRHCSRLHVAEWEISSRARELSRGSGRAAIRQMERERQRLGRELHTGVGQMMAAIRLQVEIVTTQIPDPPGPVQQALERIAKLANDALEQLRSISRRLHPPEWQRLPLGTALRQLWEISGMPQRFKTSLRIEELDGEPELEVKVLLYRAAQEALSNITRHSGASEASLSLEEQAGRVVLTIQDNGVGFDIAGVFSGPVDMSAGIGLRSIREQAAAIGARIELESGRNGTRLIVSAPFPAPGS